MAEHSELGLPWVIYDSADPLHQKIKGKHHRIGGMHVADVMEVEQAAYIVLAANQFPALSKALELIEYVSRKDSLTEQERLQSVRTVVISALAALKEASNAK